MTSDLWTDDYKKIAYLTMTMHDVSADWEWETRVLATKSIVSGTKSAHVIKNETDAILTSYDLTSEDIKNILTVTDRGTNFVKAFCDRRWLPCTCHVLETVIRRTFKSGQLNAVTEVTAVLDACKDLVAYVKRSGVQSRMKKSLKQAVDTRWSSKYDMIIQYWIPMKNCSGCFLV